MKNAILLAAALIMSACGTAQMQTTAEAPPPSANDIETAHLKAQLTAQNEVLEETLEELNAEKGDAPQAVETKTVEESQAAQSDPGHLVLYEGGIAGTRFSRAGYIDGVPDHIGCNKMCVEIKNESGDPVAVFVDSRRATIFGGYQPITLTTMENGGTGTQIPASVSVIPPGRSAVFRMMEPGTHTFTMVAYTPVGGGFYKATMSNTQTWGPFPLKYAKKKGMIYTIRNFPDRV